MNENIVLNAPVTLTLPPAHVQIIMEGLKELPYKFSQPVIDYLVSECRKQAEPTC